MERKPLRIVKEGDTKVLWTVLEKDNGQWIRLKSFTLKRDAQTYIRSEGRSYDLTMGKHDSE